VNLVYDRKARRYAGQIVQKPFDPAFGDPKDIATNMGEDMCGAQLYHHAHFTAIGCTVAETSVPTQMDR